MPIWKEKTTLTDANRKYKTALTDANRKKPTLRKLVSKETQQSKDLDFQRRYWLYSKQLQLDIVC